MRCIITSTPSRAICLIPLLLKRPSLCKAFLTSSKTSDVLRLQRFSTTLLAGREKRVSSSKEDALSGQKNTLEEQLIANEETARQQRLGQVNQRLEKSVRREERIAILEMKADSGDDMPEAEILELKGLLGVRDTFEEQYDPLTFSKEHLEFKAMHNDALIALSRYCERERAHIGEVQPINVFFLDGPDGGTLSALIDRGDFDAKQCFVANRHLSSVNLLKITGGGRLPDENVIHATAAEALTVGASVSLSGVEGNGSTKGTSKNDIESARGEGGAFSDIDFSAYYFDGCGGFVPHIVNMISAALLREDCDAKKPIAVGYSLLGGNKDVVQKELSISRALTVIARRRGMRMVHVLDDPITYGISLDTTKVGGSGGGGTFTTWHLLESI